MTEASPPRELVVLVADRGMEAAVEGLLGRHASLGIRDVAGETDTFVHPEKDPGCRVRGADFLRGMAGRYAHAILMFDYEGCGDEALSPAKLEEDVERSLSSAGWGDRAAAIVLDPELEAWVWSDSPQVDSVLGWRGRSPDLRTWLRNEGQLSPGAAKPARPKEAYELALRAVRKPRSASVFHQLASAVSLRRCTDPAFSKFKSVLKAWFAG